MMADDVQVLPSTAASAPDPEIEEQEERPWHELETGLADAAPEGECSNWRLHSELLLRAGPIGGHVYRPAR